VGEMWVRNREAPSFGCANEKRSLAGASIVHINLLDQLHVGHQMDNIEYVNVTCTKEALTNCLPSDPQIKKQKTRMDRSCADSI